MRFPFPRKPARSRTIAIPASYAKLLLTDRETKNAIAGVAAVFVAVLLLARSASPAPAPDDPGRAMPPPDPAAPAASAWLPAPRLDRTAWTTNQQSSPLLAAYAAPSRAASPFFYKGSDNDREHALDCLATAAWYEAGNDAEGQQSVIQVVLNRVRHPTFPSSVCGVIFQGSERATGCQFTFTCDGSMQRRFPSTRQWKAARQLAEKALEGTVDASVGQATHYHADYVAPWWSSALQRVSQIGAHIFYRWPGGQGHLAGNRNWGTEAEVPTTLRIEDGRPSATVASEPGALVSAAIQPAVAPAGPMISPAASRAHLIAIDPRSASGRWAVTALGHCEGQPSCSVFAYGQADQLSRNMNLEPIQMERPLFLFVRDPASKMELALWDCDRIQRPQASQCLPKDRAALLHLMRNR